jgi:uncharacterized Ntn-hydrolase superfamily protein
MTWSIIARDASGALGITIASRFFAVGALCPYARAGVGAVATQALVNPLYGPAALEHLAAGNDPALAIERLVAADPGRAARQVHVVDAAGRSAAYTGADCVPWCGHLAGDGFSVAGNMLAGAGVIDATADAYRRHASDELAERLMTAMEAGEAAGGDKRGKQSIALLIVTTEAYPVLDIRVDDHPEPHAELRRLYAKSLERFQPFVACLPSRRHPAGIVDREAIEREIERFRASHATATSRSDA